MKERRATIPEKKKMLTILATKETAVCHSGYFLF